MVVIIWPPSFNGIEAHEICRLNAETNGETTLEDDGIQDLFIAKYEACGIPSE
jgi:hypothetical protein